MNGFEAKDRGLRNSSSILSVQTILKLQYAHHCSSHKQALARNDPAHLESYSPTIRSKKSKHHKERCISAQNLPFMCNARGSCHWEHAACAQTAPQSTQRFWHRGACGARGACAIGVTRACALRPCPGFPVQSRAPDSQRSWAESQGSPILLGQHFQARRRREKKKKRRINKRGRGGMGRQSCWRNSG